MKEASEETSRPTFLVSQWLGLLSSAAGGMGSIPGWGTKILHAAQCSQKEKNSSEEVYKQGSLAAFAVGTIIHSYFSRF